MKWGTVYDTQNDDLDHALARQQLQNNVLMQVANAQQHRVEADRNFGLQQETARENTALRKTQQESLDADRTERAKDRDDAAAIRRSQAFAQRLGLLKKGDPLTGVERVQFEQEGVGGLAKAAGSDEHMADPHFHFAGTQATDKAEETQKMADRKATEDERHNREMESNAARNAATAAANAAKSGGRGELSGYQKQNLTRALRTDYTKVTAPSREMQRQLTMMESGLAEAKKGNMNAGTQAIIATFNKVLDPTSVVRESEYARSPEGMALMQRIQGAIPKLTQGGIGMTPQALEQFADLARTFTANAHATAQSMVAPILAQASDAGIEPTRITSDERAPAGNDAGHAPGSSATPAQPDINALRNKYKY